MTIEINYGDTTEKLHKALRHHGSAEEFPLVEFSTLTELVNAYTSQPGENHWFDRETLQAHGSQVISMIAPGVIIEEQENTYQVARNPDRYWKVTGWVRLQSGRITPITVAAFENMHAAQAFGLQLAQVWADHSNPNYPAPK